MPSRSLASARCCRCRCRCVRCASWKLCTRRRGEEEGGCSATEERRREQVHTASRREQGTVHEPARHEARGQAQRNAQHEPATAPPPAIRAPAPHRQASIDRSSSRTSMSGAGVGEEARSGYGGGQVQPEFRSSSIVLLDACSRGDFEWARAANGHAQLGCTQACADYAGNERELEVATATVRSLRVERQWLMAECAITRERVDAGKTAVVRCVLVHGEVESAHDFVFAHLCGLRCIRLLLLTTALRKIQSKLRAIHTQRSK